MTALERRKLFCSVTFHIVAITCVVWSLYVLIDRTAEEIRNGELQWPFWTKLVVVAIGFTGGLVFMYIQCKVYVHLCRKWKAYNRTIVVQVSCIHIFLFFYSFSFLVQHCYCHSIVRAATANLIQARPIIQPQIFLTNIVFYKSLLKPKI